MKHFLNSNFFYPNMIYPIPNVQQPQIKYVPTVIPNLLHTQANNNRFESSGKTTLEITLYHLKNRTIQILLDCFGLAVVFSAYAIIINSMDPFSRNYSCDMSGLGFPKVQETIPLYGVLMFGILGPFCLFILVEFFNARLYMIRSKENGSLRERFKKFLIITSHCAILFAFGVGVLILVVAIANRYTSKMRPNFLSICRPASNLNCLITQVGAGASGSIFNSISTGGTFCTGNSGDIKEARMSFPSFHTSFATYTMLFLCIYLQARLISLRFRSLRPLLQITAVIAALVTAASRYEDYYADGWDVLGGFFFGSIIAILFTMYSSRVLWDYNRKSEFSELSELKDTVNV